MKKKYQCISLAISIIGSLLISGCISTQSSQVKEYDTLKGTKRVAVMEVKNKTKYGARNLSDAASEILTSELSRSGSFTIIEREKLDKILAEQELQMSDITDSSQAASIGKILNCEYMLTGAISNFGVKTEGKSLIIGTQKTQTILVEVDIKVIKVETAEVVYSAYGKGTVEKEISNLFGVGASGGYDEGLAGEGLRAALSVSVNNMIKYFKKNP
jgi:curli biogenesis system outer membrane secretion channel CsgG